jgi:GTP pyrophosphokinase
MVKVRTDRLRLPDGRIDVDGWVRELGTLHPQLDAALLARACRMVAGLEAGDGNLLESGTEFAELVAELELDTAAVAAGLLYRALRSGAIDLQALTIAFGDDVAHLLDEVSRMATTSLLEMNDARLQTSERRNQIENVRRMLVAMIDDARVAVLKLAERVVALRHAKHAPDARRERIAREAHLIFAPLANRLGIWRIKWELEDLSLRYLAPDIYKSIAGQLGGRRAEREHRVAEIARDLEAVLRARGIPAVVNGRAKHIFSIWRKMQSKHVGIGQVHDVRAVRVLVDDVAQCYATLGVIHTQWRHIPSEFDDYIAAPKENGYRSIHTAVRGPDDRTLEVQIRTHEMHREAELGVCAHWAYKLGEREDRPFAEKMNWLRQVVERGELERDIHPLAAGSEFSDDLRQAFRGDRIFVHTPKGHVVDLISGATPVDFAYRVHTHVGHRCCGALVDGERVPLWTPLRTGQRVEVLTGDRLAPDRDWLELHLGFVRTSRARDKLHEWFRSRDADVNEREGRARIETLLRRIAIPRPRAAVWREVAGRLGFGNASDLFRGIGAGDCHLLDVIELLVEQAGNASDPARRQARREGGKVRIRIQAIDRPGLLRDITAVLGDMNVELRANTGRVDSRRQLAIITLEIRAPGVRERGCLVDRLCHLDGVLDARCIFVRKPT